jgi:hypothetical protein
MNDWKCFAFKKRFEELDELLDEAVPSVTQVTAEKYM